MPSVQNIIKEEFRLLPDIIYLNHAAVSPWPARTARAVQGFSEENMTEGSLNYPEWLKKESELRRLARKLINAPSVNDIALLKNTSEALSLVAYGLEWNKGDNIVSSNQEFPSNRIVWQSLASKGVEFRQADLSTHSTPEDALFSMVDKKTKLITISSVQYGSGLQADLKQIGDFCRAKSILFCVDAIQSIGAVQFDVQDLNADFVMADGHKWMCGPEGLALFYSHPEARNRLHLTQYGWHMVKDHGNFDITDWEPAETSRRFECGSPNMLGIHALNASLSLLSEIGMQTIEKEVLRRTKYIMSKLLNLDDVEIITPVSQDRYAGIITFRKHTEDNEGLFNYLLSNNIFCALRGGGIRLSPHFYTPLEHIDKTIDTLIKFK